VARWVEDLRERGGAGEADQVAEELAAGLRLGEGLADLPPEVRRLTVVPDDSLHGFPLAAFRHRGRYLAEDYAITVALDHVPRARPGPAGGGPALAVAVSRGASPDVRFPRGVPPLPGTRPEAAAVAAWFRARGVSCPILEDEAANCATVLASWREAAFVHAACHGIFRPDRPGDSGLVLIPSDAGPEVLRLRDLAGLRCPRLRHVTLSNCWLADSYQLPGRASVGLPEVLYRAGAGSVLGCLWPVHDRAGAFFAERFYQHATTQPRDQAVAAARRDLLHHVNPAWRRPFCWAGHQFYGDPGPLLG
jgi:CHAT domain-containing protein